MTPRHYTADSLADLKAKIRALRARTTERGCTEAEALAAAAKATELMSAHGLSADLVDRPPFAEATIAMPAVRFKQPWASLLSAIRQVCAVDMWCGPLGLTIFGFEPDVIVAEYMVDTMTRAVERARADFRRTPDYTRRRTERTKKKAVDAFVAGFVLALANKILLRVQRSPESGEKARLIKAEIERRRITLTEARAGKQQDHSKHAAFSAGVRSGRATAVHTGVDADRRRDALSAPALSLPAPGARS